MEIDDVLRRARSMALALPRQFGEIVNARSVENAREEVRVAGFRRQLHSVLEEARPSDGSSSFSEERAK